MAARNPNEANSSSNGPTIFHLGPQFDVENPENKVPLMAALISSNKAIPADTIA